MDSIDLRRTEEKRWGPNRYSFQKTERSNQTKPLVDANNPRHATPMRLHDVCNITRFNPIILRNEYKVVNAEIFGDHLTLGKVCLPQDADRTHHLSRRLQRELSRLFQSMPFVLVYINDILIITKGKFE